MFSTMLALSGVDESAAITLKRRERPELVLDPKTGAPLQLLNGASVDDSEGVYRAFSLLQEVNTAQE